MSKRKDIPAGCEQIAKILSSDVNSRGELLLYRTEDGTSRINVRFDGQTLWLSQADMAELFQTSSQNITTHIKEIYAECELSENSTCKDCLQVRQEGTREVRRSVKSYSLPLIIAVGYRVRSTRGTQFRQWATAKLEEFLVKGFTMDDERLKNPPAEMPDYFDDMLERIRDIRSSERRVYLRLREILALAADYNPKDIQAQEFFQTVQNKLHFAVTGMTAPELIAARVDALKPNMGLTAWKGGFLKKSDTIIAKNYLNENEIGELNRIVVMFLDFAEDQARRRKQIFLANWQERLDSFLKLNDREILAGAGSVSRETADSLAHEQYELFKERRRLAAEAAGESDFVQQLEDATKQLKKPAQ